MQGYKRIIHAGQPAITQAVINGWQLTWNPDDKRYYLEAGERKQPNFKDYRNAVQYAKKHSPA